jgi:AcrR family transcriptional regulator
MPSKAALPAGNRAEPRRRGRPPAGDESRLRQDIVRASARLFRAQGYERTSVRDIAAAVGIQSGSWFYHFKTKHEILLAVMSEGLAEALATIEAIAALPLPARERLRRLVAAHLATLVTPGHDFVAVTLYEWRSLDEAGRRAVARLTKRYEDVWDALHAELVASGDWALPTPVDRLLMFGAMNWVVQWYHARGARSLEDLTEATLQFLLRTPATPAAALKRPTSARRSARPAR